jgi:hypothetical protein
MFQFDANSTQLRRFIKVVPKIKYIFEELNDWYAPDNPYTLAVAEKVKEILKNWDDTDGYNFRDEEYLRLCKEKREAKKDIDFIFQVWFNPAKIEGNILDIEVFLAQVSLSYNNIINWFMENNYG